MIFLTTPTQLQRVNASHLGITHPHTPPAFTDAVRGGRGSGGAWDCGKVSNEGEVLNNLQHLFPLLFYFYFNFLLKALMEQCRLERHQPEGQDPMRHATHLRQQPEKSKWKGSTGRVAVEVIQLSSPEQLIGLFRKLMSASCSPESQQPHFTFLAFLCFRTAAAGSGT